MAFEYKVDNGYVTCNDAYYVLNSSYKKVTSAFMSVGGKYTPVFVSIVEPTQTNHNVSVTVYNVPDGADYNIESYVRTSSGLITSDLTNIPAGSFVSIHVDLPGYSGSYSGNGWETGGSLPNYDEFDSGLGIQFTMPDHDLNLTLYLYCADLMRPIRYVDLYSYNDVDISYLPGIPTSAQIGSTVDLTPWFENSPNGYVAECIDWQDEIGAGNWVVGDGYGDLTFEMPSMGIIVMTSGVPDGSEEEPDYPTKYNIYYDFNGDLDIVFDDQPTSAYEGEPVNIIFDDYSGARVGVTIYLDAGKQTFYTSYEFDFSGGTGMNGFTFEMPACDVLIDFQAM